MQPELEESKEKLDQKENFFYSLASEKLQLSEVEAKDALDVLLKNIVRRISPGEAMDFLDQLPANIRDRIEDEPAGPDTSINAATIINEVKQAVNIEGRQPEALIKDMWNFLADVMDENVLSAKGELSDILSQMPSDVCDLFLSEDDWRVDKRMSS